MNTSEAIITVAEASKICGVTRATVWRWIKQGDLKAGTTAGGHHRIQEQDLASFMDKRKMHASYRGKKQFKILIVDDDETIQELFRRFLSNKQFRLEFASDGFEAGIQTNKFKPDLIILDLYLPKVDGFNVCDHIKNNKETKHIKILAISGDNTEAIRTKIMKAGADFFFSKPFDMPEIQKKIENLLKQTVL